jgi:sterol desaturase/sphingolipid hydroxylase (fatty acid hydroxylase superfamily)
MLENEIKLRLLFFLGVILTIFALEFLYPRRKVDMERKLRWTRNLLLMVINNLTIKFFLPFSLVTVALYAEQKGVGLFHNLTIYSVVELVISLIVLDFIIYMQHRIFHYLPFLWRFHKIHHIDHEMDVTTAIRFHPIEIFLSFFIKSAAIIILGISPIAVIIFVIILNVSAMFSHGNITVPKKLDQLLRLVIITPDMHRIHHCVIPSETNSNFGFNLSWWDKIFNTYKAQPSQGHDKMKIGLNEYQDASQTNLMTLLLIPFGKQKTK